MICSKCGVENKDDSRFCMGCGSLLEEVVESESKEENKETIEENTTSENPFISPAKDTLVEEDIVEPSAGKKFCQNCGNELTPGLKFCGECGTAVNGRAKASGNNLFSDMGDMIKMSVKKPSDLLKKACNEKYAKASLVFLLIKDLILAVLKSATIGTNLQGFLGNFGEIGDLAWGMTGWNGFQAVLHMFILFIIVDAVFILLYLAAGKMFGSKTTLKQWIGTFTSAVIFPSILSMIGIILSVLSGVGILLYLVITIVSMIIFFIELTLGFTYAMKLEENKNIYAFMVGGILIVIVSIIIVTIIGAITAASAIGTIGGSVNDLLY